MAMSVPMPSSAAAAIRLRHADHGAAGGRLWDGSAKAFDPIRGLNLFNQIVESLTPEKFQKSVREPNLRKGFSGKHHPLEHGPALPRPPPVLKSQCELR
jgi:hypothetical protein